MTIIVNQDSLNISANIDLLSIISNPIENNIVSIVSNPVIESNNPVLTIVPQNSEGVVKSLGIQGPSGPIGPIGITGGISITHITPVNLGGNRVVTASFDYADSGDLSTAGKAIGITSGAAVAGNPVTIIVSNELSGFFGLTPNSIVYLSINGTITQTPPTTGYLQKVGVAIDSTTLLINILEPIIL